MLNQIIIQGVGIIALVLFVSSFQAKSRSNILYIHILGMIIYAIHFFLLGAWTAVAMVSINAVKSYVFSFKETKKWAQSKYILFLFLVLFWVFGLLTWEGYHSLFVILALNFVTLSHWSTDTKKLRGLFMFSHPLWVAYDLVVGSYAGIISEIVVFTSGLIGMWRFKDKKMQIKETQGISKESVLNKEHNIWVGISLGNKYFTKENIEEYIKWALLYTKEKVLVVIADVIHAINLEVIDDRKPESAMTKALKMGDAKFQEIVEIIKNLPKTERDKIRIVRWSEVLENDKYKRNLELIKEEFKNNQEFYNYIIDIVLNGRKDRAEKLASLPKEKLDRLAEYVLSELPHFINGVQGYGDDTIYTVLPYPGLNKLDELFIGLSNGTMFKELSEKLKPEIKIGVIEAYVE
jgi:tRNA-dependent cyclodipeptide synthase